MCVPVHVHAVCIFALGQNLQLITPGEGASVAASGHVGVFVGVGGGSLNIDRCIWTFNPNLLGLPSVWF